MVYEKREIIIAGELRRSKWQQLTENIDELGLTATEGEVEELTGVTDGPVRVIGQAEFIETVGSIGGNGRRSWRALANAALHQTDGTSAPEEDELTKLRFQVNPAEDIYAPRDGVRFLDEFDGLEFPAFRLFTREVDEIYKAEGTGGLPQSILGRGVGPETINGWVEIAGREDLGYIIE